MSLAVVLALVWANIAAGSYAAVWEHPLSWSAVPGLRDVRGWVDDGLMTVFFLSVGLEVGRERACGSLQGTRNAVLPVVAAAGGMLGAAVAYLATVAAAGPSSVTKGWGVPMATDVAFTLGAMALLGRRVPPALRVLVLALAVADDVGSVVILAVVSSSHLRPAALAGAAAVLAATVLLRRRAHVSWWPYAAILVIEWVLLAVAGVDPTLAGAFVGILVPCAPPGLRSASARMEKPVAPAAILGVLPVFVVANAGITFTGFGLGGGAGSVLAGVLVARLAGKAAGIMAAAALVVRFSVVELAEEVRWAQLAGAAILCGMGFTVPLLFADTAFAGHPALLDASRLGLLAGTVLSFAVGSLVLVRTSVASRRAPGGGGPTPDRDDKR